MKNTFRNIAAGTFIALLLMVGNVKASDTEATRVKAIDSSLQVENWMTNETIWNNNTTTIMNVELEKEATLELENWMIDAESWNININFDIEVESALELESWMTSDATWNRVYNDTDTELTVEDWMINSNIWE